MGGGGATGLGVKGINCKVKPKLLDKFNGSKKDNAHYVYETQR